jgi:hypothetical protein
MNKGTHKLTGLSMPPLPLLILLSLSSVVISAQATASGNIGNPLKEVMPDSQESK